MQINEHILSLAEKLISGEVKNIELPGVSYIRAVKDERICIAVTCHTDYLCFLADQIHAVDNQKVKADEKFLILDGCEIPYWLRARTDWRIIKDSWKNPNPGRNLAIEATDCDWICFADADDIMHSNYIASIKKAVKKADDKTAVIYADLKYTNEKTYKTPDYYDYWRLRQMNFVSACSAWRKEAVTEAGSFPASSQCYDDYSLALRITALGWKCEKQKETPIMIRSHSTGERRHLNSRKGLDFFHKWNIRTFGIVTLFSGRPETLSAWENWIDSAALPSNTTIYVINNSNSVGFDMELKRIIKNIYRPEIKKIVYQELNDKADSDSDRWEKHRFVCKLYNKVIPQVSEDYLLLWEDDVIPPYDGLKKLVEEMNIVHHVGAVSGIYQSRSSRCNITGAYGGRRDGKDYWHNILTYDAVKTGRIIDVDFVGGGFTLFNNAVVQKSLPFRFTFYNDKYPGGWDSDLSRSIRKAGCRIKLHSDVLCEHLVMRYFSEN